MEHPHVAANGNALLPDWPDRPGRRAPTERPPLVGMRARSVPGGPDDRATWQALLGEAQLGTAELQALAALVVVHTVPQGQRVLSCSAHADTLVALHSGEVALGLRTSDGTFRTERIVRGPAWLDQSSAWLDEPHAMDARAQTAATLLALPRHAVAARLAQLPGLAQRLIQGLAREVQTLTANTHELMHKDAPARLAQWLCQHSEAVAGQPGQAVVRLAQRKRDVASQLAMTPETLSRLMRSFTRQGVIEVAGYTLRVLDTGALSRLAQG